MSLFAQNTALHSKGKRRGRKLLLPLSVGLIVFVVAALGFTSRVHAQRVDEDGVEIFEPDDDAEEEEIFGPSDEEGDGQADESSAEDEAEDSLDIGASLPGQRSGPPAGYESVEVIDWTIGFRDDAFSSISIDTQGVLWVSTYQGRIYKSTDGGENWNEYTVIPEVKPLWGFVGQNVLLGHVRNPSVGLPRRSGLPPGSGIEDGRNYQLLLRNDPFGATTMGGEDGFALDSTPSFATNGGNGASLQRFSEDASGGGSVVLGAGLSNRAPRLSLLLAVLKRPIANISLNRLLLTTTLRSTTVREITPHPTDKGKVFAGTAFGLFRSTDDGQSWYRDFAGLTPAERWIGHVLPDPKNPKRVYMGTSRGLFMSDDGGDSWAKNTRVPEISIRRVAIDPTDSNYVYVAGTGGVFRSSDAGANFSFIYYHSIPKARDVNWMAIDPFDPNIAYLGTQDGLFRTTKLRTATIDDWEVVAGLRTVNLAIGNVQLCSKHPGHVYISTRADLPTISYGAHGPESLLLESWDHGLSWRELVGNQTQGDIQWFTLDPSDTDSVWVAFSRALVQLRRQPEATEEVDISQTRLSLGRPVLPDMPSMSQVIRAALVRNQVEMSGFVDRLDSLRSRNWLPNHLNLGGGVGFWNVGAVQQEIQFIGDRFLNVQGYRTWNVTAWLSWRLPDFLNRADSAPMGNGRELRMLNGLRERILQTIHRNYGELQRVRARQRFTPSKRLLTRVNMALRAQYLEALVDLTTGGYLTEWNTKENQ